MAITAATLTTTVTDSITLNGTTYGNTVTKTHGSVKDVFQRTISVPLTETILYSTVTGTDTGSIAGAFDEDGIKYMRVSNIDTNFIHLHFEMVGGDEMHYKLEGGKSFILNTHNGCMETENAGADLTPTNAISATNGSIKTVTATAFSAVVDVELFVASILPTASND